MDGQGIPDGLAGDAIPREARVCAVADAFDAMMSARPYRRTMSVDGALAELRRHAGTQFDPEVVRALLEAYARGEFVPCVQQPPAVFGPFAAVA